MVAVTSSEFSTLMNLTSSGSCTHWHSLWAVLSDSLCKCRVAFLFQVFNFVCMHILPACISAQRVHAKYPQKRVWDPHELELDGCDHPGRGLVLATEPSLQPRCSEIGSHYVDWASLKLTRLACHQ